MVTWFALRLQFAVSKLLRMAPEQRIHEDSSRCGVSGSGFGEDGSGSNGVGGGSSGVLGLGLRHAIGFFLFWAIYFWD
jgi:hypothetical protein